MNRSGHTRNLKYGKDQQVSRSLPVLSSFFRHFCNTLFLLLCMQFVAQAVTYYTISNGDWNNTSVWSTDGITACWCAPSDDIDGFDAVIRHTIDMTSDITIKSGYSLTINVNAVLTGDHELVVKNGDLNANGTISVKQVKVETDGRATFNGPVTTSDDVSIKGLATLNANITLNRGDFKSKGGAAVFLLSNSQINLVDGDLTNAGSIDFDSSCTDVSNGSFKNFSSGTITGVGSINVQSGNVVNSGSWSLSVDWCASGTGTGLPLSTKCLSANCAMLSVLPIELSFFKGNFIEGNVLLTWQTLSESNNKYFTLERKVKGSAEAMPDQWEEIATVQGVGNSNSVRNYSLLDERPRLNTQRSTIYYRLKQTDHDGKFAYSNIIAVAVALHLEVDISIYPNPSSGQFTVEMYLESSQVVHLEVYDLLGKRIYKEVLVQSPGNLLKQVDLSHHAKGIYNLKLKAADSGWINKRILLY